MVRVSFRKVMMAGWRRVAMVSPKNNSDDSQGQDRTCLGIAKTVKLQTIIVSYWLSKLIAYYSRKIHNYSMSRLSRQ